MTADPRGQQLCLLPSSELPQDLGTKMYANALRASQSVYWTVVSWRTGPTFLPPHPQCEAGAQCWPNPRMNEPPRQPAPCWETHRLYRNLVDFSGPPKNAFLPLLLDKTCTTHSEPQDLGSHCQQRILFLRERKYQGFLKFTGLNKEERYISSGGSGFPFCREEKQR